MSITVEAVYENGVLKPAQPLDLQEHERVHLTVLTSADRQAAHGPGSRGYGLVQWTGSLADLDYLIEDAGERSAGGAMTFDDLIAGQAIFVDANVLLYYFTAHPRYGPACQKLLCFASAGIGTCLRGG